MGGAGFVTGWAGDRRHRQANTRMPGGTSHQHDRDPAVITVTPL